MEVMLKKRIIGILIISLCVIVTIGGCGKEEPIKIGFIAGLSGKVADLGVAGRNGVMLAVEQKNAQGGINGRPVDLIVRDDQQNPVTAKKAVQELLDQGVEVIIGPMTSSMGMAITPLVNQSDSLLVSPTVTTTRLSGKDDHFLRVSSTTQDYASKSARYQFAKLQKRKAVAIYDLKNEAYTKSWLDIFTDTFENMGGEILKEHSFTSSSDTVFHETVKSLLKVEPDLFIIITNAVDAALICQQIRKLDNQISIAMSEWASTERFIELAGTSSEGVYVAQFLERNNTSEQYIAFKKAYHERFNQEHGFAGVSGYDAATVVLNALAEKQKNETLKDTVIRLKKFQGVQQVITIDKYGDADRRTFVTVIRKGKYKTIE